MNPRDYQIAPIEIGTRFLQQKKTKPSIIVAPTAAGKSYIIAEIAKRIDKPLIVLQPTKELLEQNYEKFTALGGVGSIYSASFKKKELGMVTYATIGSVIKAGEQVKDLGIKHLIQDECHLFPRSIDGQFRKFISVSEITHSLGLTATAFKLQNNTSLSGERFSKLQMLTSRSGKGKFFSDIIHVTQICDIREKYWSKLLYKESEWKGQLVFNSSGGDFTEESIRNSYEKEQIEEKIKEELSINIDRKHILVFVPSILDAQRLSKEIKGSACVYSGMKDGERKQIIKDFRAGNIRIVFNVNILSTGFDYPEIDCIIIARPMASLALFYQIVGRGTRIHENKQNCLIIDLCGNLKIFGKIEGLYYKKEKDWQLYNENNIQISNTPLNLL